MARKNAADREDLDQLPCQASVSPGTCTDNLPESGDQTAGSSQAELFWNEHRWQGVPVDYWSSNPLVQAYINRRITGDPAMRWLDWLQREYIRIPLKRGLCLACGTGTAEIHACAINMCLRIDACDISEKSLVEAKKKARRCGLSSRIRYLQCDLNCEIFPVERYEIVFSSGGLHHIEHLEHLFTQIHRTLKPGGLLAVDEYIGPARLQYSDRQLEIANRVIQSLPTRLRSGKTALRPTVEHMLTNDPSEAVRSSELPAFLEREFDIVEKRPYGGTVLNVLYGSGAIDPRPLLTALDGKPIAGPTDADLLPLILTLEEILTDEIGYLPDDYAVIVARKRYGS